MIDTIDYQQYTAKVQLQRASFDIVVVVVVVLNNCNWFCFGI